jgi:cysteine-rich repeat protein
MLSEECDDGNALSTDSCVGPCLIAECGDGYTQDGLEECDDGDMNDGNDCRNDCVLPYCGDGLIWAEGDGEEECDDANMSNDDACTSTCTASFCGDGVLWQGMETCDDGNLLDNDACPGSCQPAFCGDGFAQAQVEECDDGNDVDDDFCTNDCILLGFPPCYSSNFGVIQGNPWVICSYDGNTAWVAANTGGTYNATAICQMLGYNGVIDQGGTCGSVCGYCQQGTSCMNLGNMNFDGGGGNPAMMTNTVHWLCGN